MQKVTQYIVIPFLMLCALSNSQSLHLQVSGENENADTVIEQTGFKKNHAAFDLLSASLDTLKTQLTYAGYFELRQESFDRINDSTYHAKLALGPKIDTIYIYTPKSLKISSRFEQKETPSENDLNRVELKTQAIPDFLNEVLRSITAQGFPFARVQLKNISRVNTNVFSADLEINSGATRKIDDIVIRGYEKFPKSFLKHYLKLKKDSPLNIREASKKLEQLNDLIFASNVRDPEILFTEDSTKLYVYLEKSTANNFDGFLGFGTNEETNNLEFDGYLNLLLINNLNFGERFYLSYKSDEIDQQTFVVDLEMPFLFNSPIGLKSSLRIFRKDSSFTTTSQNLNIFYTLNSRLNLAAGIRSTSSNNLLDDVGVNTFAIDDYNSLFYTLSSQWQILQSDNPLFPVKTRIQSEVGLGNRSSSGIETNQNLFSLYAMNIFNLNAKNSVYVNANGKVLLSEDFFDNELYRFGGITSIRGFEENSLVANIYGVLNTEYRYQLSPTIYVHSIFDFAYLQNELTDINEKLFGFGFGFGILTKAGLLKFNYANGKFEGQNFRFSDSKIHLSLNATF